MEKSMKKKLTSVLLACLAGSLFAQKIPVSKVTASSSVKFTAREGYSNDVATVIDGKVGDKRIYWASDFRNQAKPPHTITLEFAKPETFEAIKLDMVERYGVTGSMINGFRLEYYNGEKFVTLYETKDYVSSFLSSMVSKNLERRAKALVPDPHPVFCFEPVTSQKVRLTIFDSLARMDEISVWRKAPQKAVGKIVPGEAVNDGILCFSFAPEGSELAPGFVCAKPVSEGKVYSADRVIPDKVRRYISFGNADAVFTIPLPRPGFYDVLILAGEYFGPFYGLNAKINGRPVVFPAMPKNNFPWKILTFEADKEIKIELAKDWSLNAVIVSPADKRAAFRTVVNQVIIGDEFKNFQLNQEPTNTAAFNVSPLDETRGFTVFMPALDKQIFERTTPFDSERKNLLAAQAAMDSIKAASIAFVPLKNIGDFNVEYQGELKAEIHPILCWPQRNDHKGGGKKYDFIPEILLDNSPIGLIKNYTVQYYVLFDIPAGTPPGVKNGKLIVTGNNIPKTEIPVEFTVLPFILDKLDSRQYTAMYEPYSRIDMPFLINDRQSKLERLLLDDLRRHNMNSILYPVNRYPGKAEFEKGYLEVNKKLDEAGYPRKPMAWNYGDITKEVAEEVLEIVKRTGLREILFYPVDEPHFGKQHIAKELYPMLKTIPGARTYSTVSQQDVDLFGNSLDFRTYMITAVHKFEPDRIRNECERDKAIFWWYSNSAREYPAANRNKSGFFAWRAGGTGQLFWAHCNDQGDPFSDFDGGGNDHNAVYIIDGKIYSTIQWEALREGLDDLRYLYMLERLIKENPGTSQAKEAQAFLDNLYKDISVDLNDYQKKFGSAICVHIRSLWAPEKYEVSRNAVIEHIFALHKQNSGKK